MVRVNIDLDEETHKRLKIQAIEKDKGLKEYTKEIVEQAVQKEETTQKD